MTRAFLRSTIAWFGFAASIGCSMRHDPAYVPAGDVHPDIQGIYAVKISWGVNNCGGYAQLPRVSQVEVYPAPQNSVYEMIVDGREYDFFMKAGGKFETAAPIRKLTNAGDEKRTMKGAFKDGSFSAKVTTTLFNQGVCDYVTVIEGRRTQR